MSEDLTDQDTFKYLTMISKALKWAVRSGIAIGVVGHFGLKVDHILDLVLASSAAIGLLTALTNYAKHKLGWTWILMDIGLAIVCVSGIVALTTMVLKFVPIKGNREDHDRIVTLEARVKYHAETLDRMDDVFKEINLKLDEINKNLPRKN